MNKSGTSQLTVLLEAEIKQKLEMLAEVRGQTAEQLASEAIVRFLGHAEKMTAAEQAALESWEQRPGCTLQWRKPILGWHSWRRGMM